MHLVCFIFIVQMSLLEINLSFTPNMAVTPATVAHNPVVARRGNNSFVFKWPLVLQNYKLQ